MTYFVDPGSAIAVKSELDLFEVPHTQTVVSSSFYDCILPMSNAGSEGPWRFKVHSDPQWIKCNSNFIYFKIKIVKPDGTPVNAAQHVAPINLIGKTFWKQIKIRLGGQDLYDSGDMYAHKAYFETQYVYPEHSKDTHLQSQGYYKDEVTKDPTTNTDVDIDSRNNPSFKKKADLFYYGNANHSAEFIGYIHSTLTSQPKSLPEMATLEIELHRNSDKFCLLTYEIPAPAVGGAVTPVEDFKIKVEDIKFFILKRNVEKEYRREVNENIIKERSAKYPIRRSMQTNVHITQGRRSAPNQTLFDGQIPRRLILGFVKTEAFYGNYGLSPFNFRPFDVKSIKIKIANKEFPRQGGLITNFPEREYLLAYQNNNEALDLWNSDRSNGITLHNFADGDTVFVVDLTPDFEDGGHFNLLKEANVSADIEFGTAIPNGGVEMVVWAEYDNMLYLDWYRNFTTDYAK